MGQKSISKNEIYDAVLTQDYSEYCRYVHRGQWKKTPFHKFLCDYVQNFVETPTSKPYEILCIHTPPQHGKSATITETFPSWYLGRHPDDSVIEISYNEDFAKKFGRRNKRKIAEYGQELFGIELSEDSKRADTFEIKGHQGGMLSRGIGTSVTGNPAHLMIIDDPIKNKQEAYSQNYRDRLFDEWISTFRSRLSAGAKVIIIMTRWHEDDLVGRLLQTETNIRYLRLPCECESKDDLLGRAIGDALCPELGKDRVWLHQFKESMITSEGTLAWNALYQGRPTAQEGNLIKREWWGYYDELPEMADWIMSVDAAFKDEAQNDYVAIQVWGKVGPNMYLVDAVKKHLNFPNTVLEIRRLRGMYDKCKVTLIEDKANGSAIITMLRSEMTGIVAIEPNGNKISRVQSILGAIESGNVYVPSNRKWSEDFINECASFPNGAHDDQVDAMSQALNRLIYQSGALKKKRELSAFERLFPNYFKNQNNNGLGTLKPI